MGLEHRVGKLESVAEARGRGQLVLYTLDNKRFYPSSDAAHRGRDGMPADGDEKPLSAADVDRLETSGQKVIIVAYTQSGV